MNVSFYREKDNVILSQTSCIDPLITKGDSINAGVKAVIAFHVRVSNGKHQTTVTIPRITNGIMIEVVVSVIVLFTFTIRRIRVKDIRQQDDFSHVV